ncbi:MAG: hypothetical protein LKF36_01465 [Lactobacillus sp.]|jgi:hypothetical protein|nr:hypothetical protein [Lactobacillus sp.]
MVETFTIADAKTQQTEPGKYLVLPKARLIDLSFDQHSGNFVMSYEQARNNFIQIPDATMPIPLLDTTLTVKRSDLGAVAMAAFTKALGQNVVAKTLNLTGQDKAGTPADLAIKGVLEPDQATILLHVLQHNADGTVAFADASFKQDKAQALANRSDDFRITFTNRQSVFVPAKTFGDYLLSFFNS